MKTISWVKSVQNEWFDLEHVNLANVAASGVYVIWYTGQPGRYVKVGQGNIRDRLTAHRGDNAILAYRRNGKLKVTWAAVPAADLDGVERFLGDRLKPLVADRFPAALPIAVNLPHAA